jgi:hypothetical protein
MKNAALVTLSVIAGNFVWEATLGHNDWSGAVEHSFFQVVIVVALALVGCIKPDKVTSPLETSGGDVTEADNQ